MSSKSMKKCIIWERRIVSYVVSTNSHENSCALSVAAYLL